MYQGVKVEAIQGKELSSPLHLGVVAIEKGAFWLPSTTVANFTLLFTFNSNKQQNYTQTICKNGMINNKVLERRRQKKYL